MTTKQLLSLLLCALMAAPTVSFGKPAGPSAAGATTTTATPHLPDAAFRAGMSESRDVFSTDLNRSDGRAAAPQTNHELRTICLADCERELQQCESDRRAGVHTQNCAAILDVCTDVCWARWPKPQVTNDGPSDAFWIVLTAIIVGGMLWYFSSTDIDIENSN